MKIIYDLFPAHFSIVAHDSGLELDAVRSHPPMDEGIYMDKTRIVVTEDRILVATDGPTGPQIIFNETYTNFSKGESQAEDAKITTISGKMLAFAKDDNCGCGSRLRSWNAYRTLEQIARDNA
jgi:hypothetical protein